MLPLGQRTNLSPPTPESAREDKAQPWHGSHLVDLQLQPLCLLVCELLDAWLAGLLRVPGPVPGQARGSLGLLAPLRLLPRLLLLALLLRQLVVVAEGLCDQLRGERTLPSNPNPNPNAASSPS